MTITVAIPTIPPRQHLLARALRSVFEQTRSAYIATALDAAREGAARTRQRALDAVTTDWTAFLDDDDYFLPNHLWLLSNAARESGADYVYSYFYLQRPGAEPDETDPLGNFGRPFDPADPQETTITVLVRTELAKAVGFTGPAEPLRPMDAAGEDHRFLLGCLAAGATVLHVPQRTWVWSHHGANTSGRGDRW